MEETQHLPPIAILMAEHRRLERLLDSMLAFAAALGPGPDPQARRDAGRFATALRTFDVLHHAKEEDLLFPAMVATGRFPRDVGPIAVMHMEHDQGRAFVRRLEAAAAGGPEGPAWTGEVREAAEGFAGLLGSHIQREDRVLYVFAARALSPLDWERLTAAFEAHAADPATRQKQAEFDTLYDNLHDAYRPATETVLVPPPGPDAGRSGAGPA